MPQELTTSQQARPPSEAAVLRDQIVKMRDQFAAALPAHIPVERFERVLLTAVNGDPALGQADRRSLFQAAAKCAADGLMPDGRQAALVIYKTKAKVQENGREAERYIKKVQYMPMIAGLYDLVRRSGEIAYVDAQVVYENDQFDYELGDDPKLLHKPLMLGDRGRAIGAYAIAKTRDDVTYREVMSVDQIEQVRAVSKNAGPDGIWGKWWGEMARKTVFRRLSKRLPMSTETSEAIVKMLESDNEHYELDGSRRSRPAIELHDGFEDRNPPAELTGPTAEQAGDIQDAEVQDLDETLGGDDLPDGLKGGGADDFPGDRPARGQLETSGAPLRNEATAEAAEELTPEQFADSVLEDLKACKTVEERKQLIEVTEEGRANLRLADKALWRRIEEALDQWQAGEDD